MSRARTGSFGLQHEPVERAIRRSRVGAQGRRGPWRQLESRTRRTRPSVPAIVTFASTWSSVIENAQHDRRADRLLRRRARLATGPQHEPHRPGGIDRDRELLVTAPDRAPTIDHEPVRAGLATRRTTTSPSGSPVLRRPSAPRQPWARSLARFAMSIRSTIGPAGVRIERALAGADVIPVRDDHLHVARRRRAGAARSRGAATCATAPRRRTRRCRATPGSTRSASAAARAAGSRGTRTAPPDRGSRCQPGDW